MANKTAFSKFIRIIVSYDHKKILESVYDQGPVKFGRLPSNDVHLDFPFVSRQHFQVVEENGKFFISDLGSRNGVVVAGVPGTRFEIPKDLTIQLDKLFIEVRLEAKSKKATVAISSQKSIQTQETVIGKLPEVPSQTVTRPSGLNLMENKAAPLQPRPVSAPHVAHHGNALHGVPVVSRDFQPDLITCHPGIATAPSKKLEAVVLWHDQVFEVREFENNERITIGASQFATLNVPTIPKGWSLAHVNFNESQVYVPKNKPFSVTRDGQQFSSDELLQQQRLKPKGHGLIFRLGHHDVLNMDLGGGMKLFLRYIPATKALTKKKLSEPDAALKQAMLGSAVAHGLLSLLFIIMAPETKNVPKLKNVPERYARLLVEPPKPILPIATPTPAPTPEPKKEVVKQEKKKPEPPKKIVKVEKPKPKEFKQPKKLEKQNQFPMVVKKPVRETKVTEAQAPVVKEAPPVKVESLGALAALGAISDNSDPAPAMQNIQINKNAGGLSSKTPNTQGLMGAIPSANGKLAAVGNGSVKTGGKGIGSGTAYGTQGLSGGAGTRNVAGAVVGTPKLASSSGKTEGLTRAQVMAVVQKHLGEIQACYEKSLLSNPGLAGRMEFEWDIEAVGSVSSVRVKRSTVSNGDGLGECVKGVFASMKFPKAKNGMGTTPNIGFPFGRL